MASWEGVIEFVAVVETSSFTQAAKQLNTSVAQISRKVGSLEARLSVKLLNRTTRKVVATDAGYSYYLQCKPLIEGLEQAESSLSSMQTQPRGVLRVTAPVAYGESHVAPALNRFLLEYPDVELSLHLTNRRIDLVDSGLDLAIRIGHLSDSTLIAKRLGSRQLHVCASAEYIAQHGRPEAIEALQQHTCLQGSNEHWRFCIDGEEMLRRVNGKIKCNSGVALLDATKLGLGIAQLPDYYVEKGLHTGELIELFRSNRPEREGIWVVFPQNRYLSSKTRLAIDFLVEHLATSGDRQ